MEKHLVVQFHPKSIHDFSRLVSCRNARCARISTRGFTNDRWIYSTLYGRTLVDTVLHHPIHWKRDSEEEIIGNDIRYCVDTLRHDIC